MATLWFCLVAAMLTVYVVLDGFDLGAGLVHLWVARTPQERATVIRTVGPVWDGNEVWLLAGGGALFCAFPLLFATAFSGFYLPLMIVLWLLCGRALGIELRHQIDHPAWTAIWDAVFSCSSGLLALFFGVALGNVVRGVPIGEDGSFFEPLWASFEPGAASGILDGYTVLTGLTAAAALAHHGSLWIVTKTDGPVQDRARRSAEVLGWVTAALSIAATIWTKFVQRQPEFLFGAATVNPWGYLFPLLAAIGIGASLWFRRRRRDLAAFLASAAFLAGMMLTVAFSLYPTLLPSSTDLSRSLTVHNASAPDAGLRTALRWWIPGILPVIGYFVFVYRRFAGKIDLSEHGY
ncbi:MAG TPA: cytochrome d ubiquinol oxidase subunit II [Planctomycetota bacterium]|nr:cytochrome d ubiquinol oxidase subunit II [Planctomycetota bacterium]